MYAGNTQIHLLKHRVREVKIAVGEDIYFDSGKDSVPLHVFVCLANALDVLFGALVIQAVGEGKVLGMIRDGHVFVSTLAGSKSHLFNCATAIGLNRVHVHVALDVTLFDQTRKSVLFRGFNLTAILPQLWDDIVETKFREDLLLSCCGDAFMVVQTDESVFAESISELQRALPNRDIMRL